MYRRIGSFAIALWDVAQITLLVASCTALIMSAIYLVVIQPAFGRPSEQWAQSDPEISKWFRELQRPDQQGSCCGKADAYESDTFEQSPDGLYVAIITKDYLEGRTITKRKGDKVVIPNAKIKHDFGNPTGHGWVFIGGTGDVLCYVTPGGV